MCKIVIKSIVPAVAVAAVVALGGCATYEPDSAAVGASGPAPGPVTEAVIEHARAGDAKAEFLLYKAASTPAEQRKWICLAAHHDHPQAQSELARLHWPPPQQPVSPFRRDLAKAYAWSLIAIRNGEPIDYMEERLGSAMTEDERWEATKLAAFWTPDPGECEQVGESGCFRIYADAGPLSPD